MRLPFLFAGVALSIVAGCVPAPRGAPPASPPRAAPVPVPPVVTPAPTPPGADWRDWPLTPGDWTYRPDRRGGTAAFGIGGADAVVMVRCDRAAGMVFLSRQGSAMAAPMLTLRTASATRTLAATPTGGTPAYLAIRFAARDGFFDAIGFSRGRFVIEGAGLPTLVVPAWPEILRVIEDCRG